MVDLQEAKVLEKGKSQLVLSSGYFVPVEQQSNFGLDGGLLFKSGLGRGVELGVRASWFMSMRVDLKYQFYENASKNLFLASGLNIEGLGFNLEDQLGHLRVQVPLYITYAPVPRLGFYGNFKYNYQVPGRQSGSGLHLMTYNAGVRIGNKAGIMLEVNHSPFYNRFLGVPTGFVGLSQIHGGLFVNF